MRPLKNVKHGLRNRVKCSFSKLIFSYNTKTVSFVLHNLTNMYIFYSIKQKEFSAKYVVV